MFFFWSKKIFSVFSKFNDRAGKFTTFGVVDQSVQLVSPHFLGFPNVSSFTFFWVKCQTWGWDVLLVSKSSREKSSHENQEKNVETDLTSPLGSTGVILDQWVGETSSGLTLHPWSVQENSGGQGATTVLPNRPLHPLNNPSNHHHCICSTFWVDISAKLRLSLSRGRLLFFTLLICYYVDTIMKTFDQIKKKPSMRHVLWFLYCFNWF